MPIRAIAYIAFVLIIGCWSAVDDFASGKPLWGVTGLCVTAILVWFSSAYWKPAFLSLGFLPSSALLGLSAAADATQMAIESSVLEASKTETFLVVFIVFLMIAPAYYFGGMAIWRKRSEVGA